MKGDGAVGGIQGTNGRDVVGRSFRVVKRGYDRDEVDRFLYELAAEIDRLRGQLAARHDLPTTMLKLASQTAEETVAQAEIDAWSARRAAAAEAERVFVDVFSDAQQIRAEAVGVAERIRNEAIAHVEQLRAGAETETAAALATIEQLEQETWAARDQVEAESAEAAARFRAAAAAHATETGRQARFEANAVLEDAEIRAHEIVRDACVEADRTLAVVDDETREVDTKVVQAQQVLAWQLGRLRSGSELMAQLAAEIEDLSADDGDVIDLAALFGERARDAR